MMKIRLIPIILLALVCGLLATEPFILDDEPALFRELVPDSLVNYPPVRMWTLDNGLVCLFWENHTAPVVSMRVVVKTGSMYEGEFLGAGISHYLEHVVSGGTTTKRSEEEYEDMLAGLGSTSNAYTSRNVTCYYITGTSEAFKEQLEMLSDNVTKCALDPVEVERERGVITQEIYKNQEEPGRMIWDLFYQTAFLNHPARYPIIGYIENFLAITQEDLEEYYNRYYSPDNSILSIAGDLTFEEAQAAVDSFFGDWERSTHPVHVLPEEPAQLVGRYSEATAPIQSSEMKIAWRGIDKGHDDSWPLDLLSDVLTDGRTSRLYKRLVTEEQLCGSVSAYHSNPGDTPAQFMINVSNFDYADRDAILDAIWEEIDKIKKQGVTEREVERQRRLLIKNLMYENETVEGQTSAMQYYYMIYGRPYAIDFLIEPYMSVQPKDIQRVTQDYILPRTMTVSVLHPPLEKGEREMVSKGRSGIEFEKHVLDNGMVVLLSENNNVPHFNVQMFFEGGLRFEPEGKVGLSDFTANYMAEGLKGYPTPDMLQDYMDWNGYNVTTGSGNNTISVEGIFLPMDMDATMELIARMAFEPTFPKESEEKLKRQAMMKLAAQQNNWSSEAFYYFREKFFGDHPYGNNPTGTEESIMSFTRDEAVEFHRKYIAPNNCAVAISGPMPTDEMLSQIEKYFGKYKPSNVEFPEVVEHQLNTEPLDFYKETDRGQITLMIGFPAPKLGSEETYPMRVMNGFLSGTKGGRLHNELRGVRDLVYLVWGSTFIGPEAGTYYVMTQTSPDNYDSVYSVIMTELEKVKAGDFDEEDMDRAKRSMRESFHRGRQEQENHVVSAALNELYGLGYDYDDVYLERIDAVNKEQIVEWAKKYFNNPVVTIIGPEKSDG